MCTHMGWDSYSPRKFTALEGKDRKENGGSGPKSNRKTRGKLETRMPAIQKAYTYSGHVRPMQILQETTVNPSKSTQPPLPSGLWPPKIGQIFVMKGESQRQHLGGTWRRKGRTRHYWASPHTKISPHNSDWTNLSLVVWPLTTEMQLPEVDQSWLEPEFISGRK